MPYVCRMTKTHVRRLMKAAGVKSAYVLHQMVQDTMSQSAVYRFVREPHKAHVTHAEIAALCEALKTDPTELFALPRKE